MNKMDRKVHLNFAPSDFLSTAGLSGFLHGCVAKKHQQTMGWSGEFIFDSTLGTPDFLLAS
jgi:hypothetical protein